MQRYIQLNYKQCAKAGKKGIFVKKIIKVVITYPPVGTVIHFTKQKLKDLNTSSCRIHCKRQYICAIYSTYTLWSQLASFPGSPLPMTKNKTGGGRGEPGNEATVEHHCI